MLTERRCVKYVYDTQWSKKLNNWSPRDKLSVVIFFAYHSLAVLLKENYSCTIRQQVSLTINKTTYQSHRTWNRPALMISVIFYRLYIPVTVQETLTHRQHHLVSCRAVSGRTGWVKILIIMIIADNLIQHQMSWCWLHNIMKSCVFQTKALLKSLIWQDGSLPGLCRLRFICEFTCICLLHKSNPKMFCKLNDWQTFLMFVLLPSVSCVSPQ